jgi:hypothetical protein
MAKQLECTRCGKQGRTVKQFMFYRATESEKRERPSYLVEEITTESVAHPVPVVVLFCRACVMRYRLFLILGGLIATIAAIVMWGFSSAANAFGITVGVIALALSVTSIRLLYLSSCSEENLGDRYAIAYSGRSTLNAKDRFPASSPEMFLGTTKHVLYTRQQYRAPAEARERELEEKRKMIQIREKEMRRQKETKRKAREDSFKCPKCGYPYRLSDYDENASRIYCSTCKTELTRK